MKHRYHALCAFIVTLVLANTCLANKLVGIIAKRAEPFIVEVRGKLGPKEVKASGIVISPFGHILTTDFAVLGAKTLNVRTHNSKEFKTAHRILRDGDSNLALIYVAGAKGLPFIHLKGLSPCTTGSTYLALSYRHLDTKKMSASIGKLGSKVNLQKWAGIKKAKQYEREYIEMSAQFGGECAGGPVFDEKGRMLGMANYVLNDKKKALFFLMSTRKLGIYLSAMITPQAEKVLAIYSKSIAGALKNLKPYLKDVGHNLPIKEKVNFKRDVAKEVKRLISVSREIENQKAAQKATDERLFRKLPKKGRELHKKYPSWPYEYVKAICNNDVKKGMSQLMVQEILGYPTKTDRSFRDGLWHTTWLMVSKDYKTRTVRRMLLLFIDGKYVGMR